MSVSTTRPTLRLFWDAGSATPVRRLLAFIGPVFAVGIGQFFGPWVIAQLLNRIQAGNVTWDNSWPLVLAFLLSQIVGTVIASQIRASPSTPTVSAVRWCPRRTSCSARSNGSGTVSPGR